MKLFESLRVILLVSVLSVEISFTASFTPANAMSIPSMLNFTPIASGLTESVFITNAGDNSNRLFILQQTGQIRILKNGSLLPTSFIDISGLISNFTGSNGEQGVLGLAFDPSYTSNGYFYITYTTNNNDTTFRYTTTLARYHVSSGNPDLADTSSGAILLSIPKKYTNHNGGMIAFGPDGYLYMSMGDGGSGGDPDNNAQNLHTLLGKLLRLDVNTTPPPGQKYVIPSTNPFYGNSDPTIRKEIWAYGLRNPWRFSFDRLTGDLYIGDVGQNTEEEVDFQASSNAGGQNYGWRILEGNLCYNPSTNCIAPSSYVPPVATYDHGTNDSFGCAITGGYVYRGIQSPSLQGIYFYGDYCSGKVLGLIKNPNNTWTYSPITSTNYLISSFGQDEQGELYLANYSTGTIYHISAVTFTVTGNAGIPGATMEYMNNGFQTVVTDGSGNYSVTVPAGWSGSVTPYLTGYTFSPVSRAYSNIQSNQTAQNYTAQVCASCTDVNVTIGVDSQGSYTLGNGEERREYYDVSGGPVVVESLDPAKDIVSAIRLQSKPAGTLYSFVETMGVPEGLLSYKYYFPTYNNTWGPLNSQIRFGNLDASATTIRVTIGGNVVWEQSVPGLEERRLYFDVSGGPVVIESLDTNKKIVAAIRLQSMKDGTLYSFAETMGIPAEQLSDTYYFPTYNNTWGPLNSQLRIGNINAADTTVRVTIGGNVVWEDVVPGLGEKRLTFDVSGGPVVVESLDTSKKIVSAIRLQSMQVGTLYSFVETMGVPAGLLSYKYYFPTYNNTWGPLNSQIASGISVNRPPSGSPSVGM